MSNCLTAILATIVAGVLVLIIEYWVIKPLRDRNSVSKHNHVDDENRATSKTEPRFALLKYWQRLGSPYKVAVATLTVLAVLSMTVVIARYVSQTYGCEVMALTGEHCFQVYTDKAASNNHFFPSGFMGDAGDIRLEDTTEDVHSGTTAIKVTYSKTGSGLGWAGIVWQFPANNWGTLKDGFDLRGSRYVTFWAKSTLPNQIEYFGIGGVGRIPKTCNRDPLAQYPESLCPAVKVSCNLSNQWFRFAIAIPEDRDLNHIISGFSWYATSSVSFYLDDILWVDNPASPPWEGPLICSPITE